MYLPIYNVENPNHTSNILVWVSVIVALIIVLSLLFFLYRRMLRREMHGELQNQVEYALSNYYKMDQSNRARGTSDEV
jgi:F0F1-type ATP synthase membrane subunit a